MASPTKHDNRVIVVVASPVSIVRVSDAPQDPVAVDGNAKIYDQGDVVLNGFMKTLDLNSSPDYFRRGLRDAAKSWQLERDEARKDKGYSKETEEATKIEFNKKLKQIELAVASQDPIPSCNVLGAQQPDTSPRLSANASVPSVVAPSTDSIAATTSQVSASRTKNAVNHKPTALDSVANSPHHKKTPRKPRGTAVQREAKKWAARRRKAEIRKAENRKAAESAGSSAPAKRTREAKDERRATLFKTTYPHIRFDGHQMAKGQWKNLLADYGYGHDGQARADDGDDHGTKAKKKVKFVGGGISGSEYGG